MQDIREVYADIKRGGVKKIILDTDTYNEIDDQFALAWAVLSDRIELLSVNAAPFLNNRSTSPEDGMEKSYSEILNILELISPEKKPPVFRGSTEFLKDKGSPIVSDAAKNIVDTVMASDERIYVVAIGAITNVASAIIMKPEIVDKMAVVWLGGHSREWQNSREFNMVQDVKSAQTVMDSGVPFYQIPCMGVCDHLATTIPELEACLRGKNRLCDYLVDIVRGYTRDPYCWSKVIWDVSAIAALAIPGALDAVIIPTPVLTDNSLYAYDLARHHMIYARALNRDRIFRELFGAIGK
ncbi:MAG: nucleoside hydrolase [Clostridia bacterium]|nr:nucleoside hydrolase [Clostridia bacterium]